jgi:hypothetical protein
MLLQCAKIARQNVLHFEANEFEQSVLQLTEMMDECNIEYGHMSATKLAQKFANLPIIDAIGSDAAEECRVTTNGTVRVYRQKFTLEDAIGSHACSLEANTRVTNGIPLGSSLHLPVCTVNCVQTLKALTRSLKRTPWEVSRPRFRARPVAL